MYFTNVRRNNAKHVSGASFELRTYVLKSWRETSKTTGVSDIDLDFQ